MEEHKKQGFSPTVAIPWLFSLATIAIGIWQFAEKTAQSNREPFLKTQLELCLEASNSAAKLATETDSAEWEKARKTFWRLYWGPLGMVEDRDVAAAMVELGKMVPKQPVAASEEIPKPELEVLSLRLAHATRDLILDSWNVTLEPLQDMRQQ